MNYLDLLAHQTTKRREQLEKDLSHSPKMREIAGKVSVSLPVIPDADAPVASPKGGKP